MKKLRKKLKNEFSQNHKEYSVLGGIRDWLEQCGIKPSDKNLNKVLSVNNGSVFYPYQENDRLHIIKTLKKMKREQSSKKSK